MKTLLLLLLLPAVSEAQETVVKTRPAPVPVNVAVPFSVWNGLYLSFEVDRSWGSPKDTDVQVRLAPSFNLTKNLTADVSICAGSRVYYSFSLTRKLF